MVCKSLEHSLSYFCGLNGSFDVLMLERKIKDRQGENVRQRAKEEMGFVKQMTQRWMQIEEVVVN